jgi:hypothetical protein
VFPLGLAKRVSDAPRHAISSKHLPARISGPGRRIDNLRGRGLTNSVTKRASSTQGDPDTGCTIWLEFVGVAVPVVDSFLVASMPSA